MRKDPQFNYVISVSDACDIPSPQLGAVGIAHFSHVYNAGTAPTLESEFDELALLADEFPLARTKLLAEDVEEYFDKVFERGFAGIIHVTAGAKYSEEYAVCQRAADGVRLKWPRRNLYIVDGNAFSVGLQPLIALARKMKAEGATAAETYVALCNAATAAETYYVTLTVDYPQKNGKLANISVGLKTATVMQINKIGTFKVLKRAPISAAVQYLAGVAAAKQCKTAYVAAADPQNALKLRRALTAASPQTAIETVRTGLYTVSELGSGALTLALL